ncbi:hypothetical protein JX265_012389 [Neoarthrinium moseri]|uniref:Uncharacterized protein n=1 Tax=Neoarthrinium moseri TaxID=1658444 RepID=A0A9Q0AJU4_9PEZI|nr:hypothetical protein JX266_002991 [Neoarthrinium moseri]KAI1855034.1 hypothetical protein JX265_012389 [Neoarthrinium moseri]
MTSRRSSEKGPSWTSQSRLTTSVPRDLCELLYQDTVEKTFANECGGGTNQFSLFSKADVFEVFPQYGGLVTQDLDDAGIRSWLKSEEQPARMRLLFLDAIPEKPDLLPVTEPLLQDIFDNFKVSSRFADNLSRQHMPGRAIYRLGRQQFRHQLWYTAVLRSDGSALSSQFQSANQTLEFTRQYSYWQRFCMWSEYQHHIDSDERTAVGTATYMIWRCPRATKQAFFSTFSGESGLKLLEHPMAVHAFFTEKIVMHTHDFLAYFSNPLYQWENRASELRTPDDYTARSRAFLALARQIHQISTDYDILAGSIEHLKTQTAWFGDTLKGQSSIENDAKGIQCDMEDIFENLVKEVKLIGVYTKLYLERSKIGVDECFAMINQRDSELNIQIAQASNQDNRSLRIIQILSMIFLPGSLVSSVFGMGFFSTSPADDGGEAVFAASSRWWLYFAVSVPLTAIVMAIMLYYQWRDGTKAEDEWSRRRSVVDPEALNIETKG